MCLILTKNSVKLTKEARSKKGAHVYYKAVYNPHTGWITPFLHDTVRKVNRLTPGRRPVLTTSELSHMCVSIGFHLYTKKPRSRLSYGHARITSFKCEVQSKDIIAIGNFGNRQSVVVRRYKVTDKRF